MTRPVGTFQSMPFRNNEISPILNVLASLNTLLGYSLLKNLQRLGSKVLAPPPCGSLSYYLVLRLH